MSKLVSPHGSAKLRPLLLEGAALEAERARAETLPAIAISSREAGGIPAVFLLKTLIPVFALNLLLQGLAEILRNTLVLVRGENSHG